VRKGVLIVDDDAVIVSLLSEYLSKEGYKNILRASNGVECLSVLEANGPDIYVVLLDFKMPGIDGLAVIRHLMNVHKHAVGIVLITGFGTATLEDEFFDLGSETVVPVGYLSKPFHFKRLLADVIRTIDFIHEKRLSQGSMNLREVSLKIASIDSRLEQLNKLPEIERELLALERRISLAAWTRCNQNCSDRGSRGSCSLFRYRGLASHDHPLRPAT